MPFRSVKQRNFLKWKHPEVYQRWKGEHGTAIQKSMRLPNGKIVRFRTRRYIGDAFNTDEYSRIMDLPGRMPVTPERAAAAMGSDYVQATIGTKKGRRKVVGQLKVRGRGNPPPGEEWVPKRGYIEDIEVRPKYRRKGIATGMYLHAEKMGMKPRHSTALSASGYKWRKSVGGRGSKVKGISNKRKVTEENFGKAGMPVRMAKPPTRPPMMQPRPKPPMSRPSAMPAQRAMATRQTPGAKPVMPPKAVQPVRPPQPALRPTGMVGNQPPRPIGKADWRVGPATVSREDQQYVVGGSGLVGSMAVGGAYAARERPSKLLPNTPSRAAATKRIDALPRDRTVTMDLDTLRQFRRNPGIRINDYGHTVSLARAMSQGAELPPVRMRMVYGKQPFIMDGMHRINAAHMLGLTEVPVQLESSTDPRKFRFPGIYNRKSIKMQRRVPRQLTPDELRSLAAKEGGGPLNRFVRSHNKRKGTNPWVSSVKRVKFVR